VEELDVVMSVVVMGTAKSVMGKGNEMGKFVPLVVGTDFVIYARGMGSV